MQFVICYISAECNVGSSLTRLGHFIPGIEQFDGEFFGLSEMEQRGMAALSSTKDGFSARSEPEIVSELNKQRPIRFQKERRNRMKAAQRRTLRIRINGLHWRSPMTVCSHQAAQSLMEHVH